jgi:hypothetical protein
VFNKEELTLTIHAAPTDRAIAQVVVHWLGAGLARIGITSRAGQVVSGASCAHSRLEESLDALAQSFASGAAPAHQGDVRHA